MVAYGAFSGYSELGLKKILTDLQNIIEPVVCVAIYASEQRKTEYGVAMQTDYLGRGAKAGLYTSFVTKESPRLKPGYACPTCFER